MRRLLAGMLCAAVTAASATPAGAKERIWILPFDNLREDAELRHLEEGLPALFSVLVSQSGTHALVDREHVDRVLEENRLSATGLTRRKTQRRIGGLLDATLIVAGSFRLNGTVLDVAAHAFDPASGEVVAATVAYGSARDLHVVIDEVYDTLQAELHGRLPEGRTGWIDGAPVSNLHFMKGLGLYFSARYEHALAEFVAGSAGARDDDAFRWWRAKCHLARERWDHAYLELLGIRAESAESTELERARRQCREHLSAEQVELIQGLADSPGARSRAGG